MGQAKQKAAALAAWEASLTNEEKIIADTARTLHAKFVKPLGLTGACYRLAFFLSEYLRDEHGIVVEPVVGYSNDGTGDIMASHAWIEYNGKTTDISLSITADRRAIPPGPILLLDRPISSGTTYTYHSTKDAAAITIEAQLATDPEYGHVVEHKNLEHQWMATISKDPASIRDYLNAAPDDFNYEKIAGLLKV